MDKWPEKLSRHDLIMRLADKSRSLKFLTENVKNEEEIIEQSTKDIAKYQEEIQSCEKEIKELSKELSEFQ